MIKLKKKIHKKEPQKRINASTALPLDNTVLDLLQLSISLEATSVLT